MCVWGGGGGWGGGGVRLNYLWFLGWGSVVVFSFNDLESDALPLHHISPHYKPFHNELWSHCRHCDIILSDSEVFVS